VEIFIKVVIAFGIVAAFIGGVLFALRLWDFLGRKPNNTKKED